MIAGDKNKKEGYTGETYGVYSMVAVVVILSLLLCSRSFDKPIGQLRRTVTPGCGCPVMSRKPYTLKSK